MATGLRSQERVPENLKKQLALAVRTIQWSYGIFWSISERQPGVLEWGDGYYNGDIKTRKTVQSVEFNAGQMDFQRSEQLKELYQSLSAGEANPQARRPSAALSPEDLTDLEWYYLVCMSFVFNIGQGLPGQTLASGQPIWLRNAHYADSKVFSRSLLAKSVSIQTVVCFPFLGGVIELGVTEMVMEDPSLIQLVKKYCLDTPYLTGSISSNTQDLACAALDHDSFGGHLVTVVGCEELDMVSPNNSSSQFDAIQLTEDSFLVEGINVGASQVQGLLFMDDELCDCVHNSMNSSDCISQTVVDPDKVVPLPNGGKVSDPRPTDLQEDLHFQSVLSTLLKSSHQLVLGPHFENSNTESSFIRWKKVGLVSGHNHKSRSGTSQKLLKKVLLEIPKMHNGSFTRLVDSPEENGYKDGLCRPKTDEIGAKHLISEKKKEKLDERFYILKSLVPSINKVDKVSILDNTIEYLRELEKRVGELEPCREFTDSEGRRKRKPQDTVERISDNYDDNKPGSSRRALACKRKASVAESVEPEISYVSPTDNLCVSINDKDVLIELRCPWKEGVLLEVMDAVSSLHLDSHSVESTTSDGILSMTIKSKVKGSTSTSAGMIRQALLRFAVR